MKNISVNIGDIIYIDTRLHLSHGRDDIKGGKVRVVDLENDGIGRVCVQVEIEPTSWYNWEMLSQDQDKLKNEFGDNWAFHNPDYRSEYN